MESNTKNIVLAGLGGVAVGVLIGVLFAPAEGKKTRALIKNKADDLMSKVKSTDAAEILACLKEKIAAEYEEGKSEVKDELLEQIQKLEATIEKA